MGGGRGATRGSGDARDAGSGGRVAAQSETNRRGGAGVHAGGRGDVPGVVRGAVLAKVVFAQQQHVSKIEYQENGPTATTRGR